MAHHSSVYSCAVAVGRRYRVSKATRAQLLFDPSCWDCSHLVSNRQTSDSPLWLSVAFLTELEHDLFDSLALFRCSDCSR